MDICTHDKEDKAHVNAHGVRWYVLPVSLVKWRLLIPGTFLSFVSPVLKYVDVQYTKVW